MIDSKNVLDTFLELCKIHSPSFHEIEASEYVMARLSEIGVESVMDEAGKVIGGNAGNVIARFSGSDPNAPTVMFAAHLDTVEPSRGVEPVVEGELIFSKGKTILGADDKVGAAVLLEVARVLKNQGPQRAEVVLIFTVAEEVGLHGAKALDIDSLELDYAYTLDGSGPVGTITMRSPYQESFRVEYLGHGAHAGVEPEKGINAIAAAAKAISLMSLGRLDEETTANVGVIKGGRASNIVPDRVKVEAEARSFSLAKLEKQVDAMKEAFEEGARAVGAEIEMRVYREYDGYAHIANSPVVKLARHAIEKKEFTPKLTSTGGGSDTNVFNAAGVPAANLGVGYAGEHTVEETANHKDMVDLAGIILEIIAEAGRQQG